MSPPRVQGAVSSPMGGSFPQGIARFDDSAQRDFIQKFQMMVLPALFNFESDQAWPSLAKLFRAGDFRFSANFHEATLPVSGSPNLHLLEGAGICAHLQSHEGKLSLPEPIHLGGFYALAGFLDFCDIDLDKKGRIFMGECPCSFPKSADLTDPILSSPIGNVFPDKKVQAIPIGDLKKLFDNSGGSSAGGVGDILQSALYQVTLKAQIPSDIWTEDPPGTPHGSCHPLWAGLELYLDIPVLQKNIQAGAWKHFDFSGIKEGSKLDWPKFNLSELPLPEAFKIPEGRADLQIRFHPADKTTEIQLKNLDAKIQIAEIFGAESIHAHGEISFLLKADGEIQIQWKNLAVELPGFPPGSDSALRLSAKLGGSVILKPKGANPTPVLSEAHFNFEELHLFSQEGRGIAFSEGGPAWGGDLQGEIKIDYEPDTNEPLYLSGSLQGSVFAESQGRRVTMKNLDLDGSGGFQKVGDRFLPSLENWDLEVTGDLSVAKLGEAPGFQIQELNLGLHGDGTTVDLSLDAEKLQLGPFQLKPQVSLAIVPKVEGGKLSFSGSGAWEAHGDKPKLDLGSQLSFKTDLENWEWILSALHVDEAGKKLAVGGKVTGVQDSKGFRAQVDIAQVLGFSHHLSLRLPKESEHFSGEINFKQAKLTLSPELELKGTQINASYSTPPWQEFLAKPRVYLQAKVASRLDGAFAGPVSLGLNGSLSYDAKNNSLFFWINPKQNSQLQWGPLQIQNSPAKIDGHADLQGTWQTVFTQYGIIVGGGGVGLKNGELLASLNSEGKRVPILSGFSLTADQLWSIQHGVALAGGDGIKFESDLHVDALDPGIATDSGKRHLVFIVDRLPLNLAAYWRLLEKTLQPGGKP